MVALELHESKFISNINNVRHFHEYCDFEPNHHYMKKYNTQKLSSKKNVLEIAIETISYILCQLTIPNPVNLIQLEQYTKGLSSQRARDRQLSKNISKEETESLYGRLGEKRLNHYCFYYWLELYSKVSCIKM